VAAQAKGHSVATSGQPDHQGAFAAQVFHPALHDLERLLRRK
jgi:hypothetical protein